MALPKVNIKHYLSMKKEGALKGIFTGEIDFGSHVEMICQCRYFDKGGQKWISWPQQEVKSKVEGEKSKYFSYYKIFPREREDYVKDLLLAEMKNAKTMEKTNGSKETQNDQDNVQGDTSFLWG